LLGLQHQILKKQKKFDLEELQGGAIKPEKEMAINGYNIISMPSPSPGNLLLPH